MLNAVVLNADEFLTWIGKGEVAKPRRLSAHAARDAVADSFCTLVLPNRSASAGAAGTIVLVDQGKIRDFYAFVSTYVVEYVPFSAFFRVIRSDQIDILESDEVDVERPRAERLASTLIGVAVAEAALYLRSREAGVDGKSPTLAAVNATYSAAVLQGLVRSKSADTAAIGTCWAELRSLMGSEPLPLSHSELARFWEIVGAAFSDNSFPVHDEDVIIGTLRQSIGAGSVHEDMLADLFAGVPEFRDTRLRFGGAREDRARSVQEAIAVLEGSPRSLGNLEACLAGCLLSLLGDGSFKFLPSALSLSPRLPTAPLWFGVWAGLQESNDALTRFNCLGRRLVRDLSAHSGIYAEPMDDVSIDELRTGVLDLGTIHRGQSSALSVEIYPNVSSRQRLGPNRLTTPGADPRFREELGELRQLLNRSSTVLKSLENAVSTEPDRRTHGGSAKLRGKGLNK